MARQYVTIKQLPNGNLAIKATVEGKEEIRDFLKKEKRVSYESFWCDLLESYSINGSYEMVNPEDIGALTSAPIIGIDIFRDDESNVLPDPENKAKYWWFEAYQVVNEFELLASGKNLILQSA